ncbi:hypothetical protein L1049_009507 [Liquidambar formosana]|uniref:Uncharacterized protein n=1 Tax=Liquidambar formosana TaxID=63359 RepID=A0AAP0R3I7_LIQFO
MVLNLVVLSSLRPSPLAPRPRGIAPPSLSLPSAFACRHRPRQSPVASRHRPRQSPVASRQSPVASRYLPVATAIALATRQSSLRTLRSSDQCQSLTQSRSAAQALSSRLTRSTTVAGCRLIVRPSRLRPLTVSLSQATPTAATGTPLSHSHWQSRTTTVTASHSLLHPLLDLTRSTSTPDRPLIS